MSFMFRRLDGCGFCNIKLEKNLVVYGVLYIFEFGGFDRFDVFEMVLKGCYCWQCVIVEILDGEKIEVIIYVVIDEFYQEGLILW